MQIERFLSLAASCVVLTAIAAGCSSSSTDGTEPTDASTGVDAQDNTPTDSGGPVDGGGGGDTGTDAATSGDPCSGVVGANGAQVKKMQKLAPEVAAGGAIKSGIYTLKYWGKQSGTVGVAYELQVNLKLTLGNPNTYSVGEYYMAGSHSGGGTFTYDETAKTISFTKTCGEINVGLGAVDKGFYSVSGNEFKVFNFGLYAGGNILIFNAPP